MKNYIFSIKDEEEKIENEKIDQFMYNGGSGSISVCMRFKTGYGSDKWNEW
ncbi:hypothetical protein CLOSTHATH_03541 [Hungatella hathewayi DSM 13479]|uniref:Uncharacterized protein n=1 Tax=Hungatella hathewayi DSM 13479 TaxID=566550 RepID=D3AIV1_9FIRM|nr:hypothetical protein CLOSTHATH_03541 [Hungatella hathewayi DSM 13479]